MSAVSPDQIQTGEQNRTGAELEQQEAGILQPQTVFVILDSAETLNLVRWVRKFWKVPLWLLRREPHAKLRSKICIFKVALSSAPRHMYLNMTADICQTCRVFWWNRSINYSPNVFPLWYFIVEETCFHPEHSLQLQFWWKQENHLIKFWYVLWSMPNRFIVPKDSEKHWVSSVTLLN